MRLKKSIFVMLLVSVAAFTMVGCSKAEEPTPTFGQTSIAPAGTSPTVPSGITPSGRPSTPAMDLSTAASKLGITEQQLSEALGNLTKGLPDLATVAEKLGVSEESLMEALGLPQGGPTQVGPPQNPPSPVEQKLLTSEGK